MQDFQGIIFRWAAHQSELTAVSILAVGLLYALQGFRFARLLLAGSACAAGFLIGSLVAALVGAPGFIGGAPLGLCMGILALGKVRFGVFVSSAFTFAALAHYLGVRFHLPSESTLLLAAAGLLVGCSLYWICRRPLPIVLTTIQGAVFLVIGFVALASSLTPTLAETFLSWSSDLPVMVPMLMLMLVITGFSVQANAQQGDMETGQSWNSAQL